MSSKSKGLFLVNFSVLLFAFSGILSKQIEFPAIIIAFGRSFFSAITLFIFSLIFKRNIKIHSKKDFFLYLLVGAVLALHWWCFLSSIKLSTVAIGTITFSTFPLFVIFIEPFVTKTALSLKNLCLAVVILSGVFITIPEIDFSSSYFQGIVVGMISSFTYALMTIFNKIHSKTYEGTTITLWNHTFACLFLSVSLFFTDFQITARDISLLILLGVFATAFAHASYISSLKYLSAQIAGIISSLETVYGILLAIPLCGEFPSIKEIAGGILILGAVFYSEASSMNRVKHR